MTTKAKPPVTAFAPKAKVPKNAKNRDQLVKQMAALTVPSKQAVGIPAYPGGVVSFLIAGVEMNLHGAKAKTLPVVQLLTSDSAEKVVAFYKKKLTGWHHAVRYMATVFTEGELAKKQEDALARRAVRIHPTQYEPLLPNAKTRIDIVFDPSRAKAKNQKP